MKNAGDSPPRLKRIRFSDMDGNRGWGVDKTDNRAHVRGWYIWQKNQIQEVKT